VTTVIDIETAKRAAAAILDVLIVEAQHAQAKASFDGSVKAWDEMVIQLIAGHDELLSRTCAKHLGSDQMQAVLDAVEAATDKMVIVGAKMTSTRVNDLADLRDVVDDIIIALISANMPERTRQAINLSHRNGAALDWPISVKTRNGRGRA
jgi:hypothetical protein